MTNISLQVSVFIFYELQKNKKFDNNRNRKCFRFSRTIKKTTWNTKKSDPFNAPMFEKICYRKSPLRLIIGRKVVKLQEIIKIN